jgi:shikimate 5-dehydrogenase
MLVAQAAEAFQLFTGIALSLSRAHALLPARTP